jgi:hypothetical protein
MLRRGRMGLPEQDQVNKRLPGPLDHRTHSCLLAVKAMDRFFTEKMHDLCSWVSICTAKKAGSSGI